MKRVDNRCAMWSAARAFDYRQTTSPSHTWVLHGFSAAVAAAVDPIVGGNDMPCALRWYLERDGAEKKRKRTFAIAYMSHMPCC